MHITSPPPCSFITVQGAGVEYLFIMGRLRDFGRRLGSACAKSIAGIGKIGMNGFANVFLEVLQWDWLELLKVVFYT
jgi:hypothetical protein